MLVLHLDCDLAGVDLQQLVSANLCCHTGSLLFGGVQADEFAGLYRE
jgi:hypothetical protein